MSNEGLLMYQNQPSKLHELLHGLRTPNEGINQRNLKFWQTKYAPAVPKNLEVEVDFRPCSEGDFLTGRP